MSVLTVRTERRNVMRKVIYYVFISIIVICMCSCATDSEENEIISIDTIGVVTFSDNLMREALMREAGYEVIQKRISQRTDDINEFVIEYWYQNDNNVKHYGYHIRQIDKDNYTIIEEGESINNSVLIN